MKKNSTVHHGGAVGNAGKTLSNKSSSKLAKTKAGKQLKKHQDEFHRPSKR